MVIASKMAYSYIKPAVAHGNADRPAADLADLLRQCYYRYAMFQIPEKTIFAIPFPKDAAGVRIPLN